MHTESSDAPDPDLPSLFGRAVAGFFLAVAVLALAGTLKAIWGACTTGRPF